VDVEAAQLFFTLLALVAGGGAVLLIVSRLLARTSPLARGVVDGFASVNLWLAFLVAGTSMGGSLYFSEVADYVPCQLCWFQRIAMYPLAVLLLVAALRGDQCVRWYAVPIAALGAIVSTYHYLIEWKPSLEGGACGFGPSCADIWFRELGFVTLAMMALCGFVAVIVLTTLTPPRTATALAGDLPPVAAKEPA
jgi:disulfide bond formation protein DsbB